MSSIEQQAKEKKGGEIRYLTPLQIEKSLLPLKERVT
jgi:hypothetical protein